MRNFEQNIEMKIEILYLIKVLKFLSVAKFVFDANFQM